MSSTPGSRGSGHAPHHVIGEVSQIANVDVGVNIDVESHLVGSFTPQNFLQVPSKKIFPLSVMLAFYF